MAYPKNPHFHRVLTMNDAREIRRLWAMGDRSKLGLANAFSCSWRTVDRVIKHETYQER